MVCLKMRGNSWIDRDTLSNLYLLRGYQLAEIYGIKSPSVQYWLKKWGIKLRNKSEAQIGEKNPYWVGGPTNYVYVKLKKLARRYKRMKGCFNCGYRKCASALEFHHKDPDEKDFFITQKNIKGSYEKGLLTLKTEIEKCYVLCSNCHNEVHYNYCSYSNLHNKNKILINKIKESCGCCICNYLRVSGLEFHHINRYDKSLRDKKMCYHML